jgi:hypothetical protein
MTDHRCLEELPDPSEVWEGNDFLKTFACSCGKKWEVGHDCDTYGDGCYTFWEEAR